MDRTPADDWLPIAHLTRRGALSLRVPTEIQAPNDTADVVTLESYDDQDYGYLRLVGTETQQRIEYYPASDSSAAKTPGYVVTIDLVTHSVVHFPDHNLPASSVRCS